MEVELDCLGGGKDVQGAYDLLSLTAKEAKKQQYSSQF